MTRHQAERAAWMAGITGLLGAAIGWLFASVAFPHAWLAALTAWLGWPLGCVGLLLIHALTGGRWGYAIRPQLVAGMRTVLLLPPAVIPLLIVLRTLYPWARPDVAAHLGNRFYLNLPFFLGRGAVYLIVWLGLAGLILRALQQDIPDAQTRAARARRADPSGDYRHLCGDRHDHVARPAICFQRLRFDRDRRNGAPSAVGIHVRRRCWTATGWRHPAQPGATSARAPHFMGISGLHAGVDRLAVRPAERGAMVHRPLERWMGHRRRLGGGVPFRAALLRSAVAAAARFAAGNRLRHRTADTERGRPRLVARGAGVRAQLRSGRCVGDARPDWNSGSAGATCAAVAGLSRGGATPCPRNSLTPRDMSRPMSTAASSGLAWRWCWWRCLVRD